MKKSLIFSAIILLLAVIFVTAQADEPVNPYREEVAENERMILKRLLKSGWMAQPGFRETFLFVK